MATSLVRVVRTHSHRISQARSFRLFARPLWFFWTLIGIELFVCVASAAVNGSGSGNATGGAAVGAAATSKPTSAEFFLYPEEGRVRNDGVGGHVARLLPLLDVGIALGLRIICNPAVLWSGKTEDPFAFSTLVGCVNRSNPNITKETASWAAHTDWVDNSVVNDLPRIEVELCDFGRVVTERRRAKTKGSVVFVLLVTVTQLGERWGSLGGPWLRRQFHAVRQERIRLWKSSTGRSALVVDGAAETWRGVRRGSRVAVHYRTGMWSLMPIHRFMFKTFFDQASHSLQLLERAGVLRTGPSSQEHSQQDARSKRQRVLFTAVLIEDEQAINRTMHEVGLLSARYQQSDVRLMLTEREKARSVHGFVRDIDALTTADVLVAGVGQFGALAAMLLQPSSVSIRLPGQNLGPRLANTLVLDPMHPEQLPSRTSAEQQQWKPLDERGVRDICVALPQLRGRERMISSQPPGPAPKAMKDRVKQQLQERVYLGPRLPSEEL
eukprot:TRINITY_DN54868_c0_g1_i1.p1 TRINITY_DN54868_c0_g1~~TRINITY_DN54868_c0_g1_i1.p1  ORF type:complete len:496 (+),score=50.81 TRINITY_DN54868_c0_g1_i1:45-1532(+)